MRQQPGPFRASIAALRLLPARPLCYTAGGRGNVEIDVEIIEYADYL
jgi:hypothetical protein